MVAVWVEEHFFNEVDFSQSYTTAPFLISFKNYSVARKMKNLPLFYVSSSVSSDTVGCNSKPANIENISGGWICFYDKLHTFGPCLTWQMYVDQMMDSQHCSLLYQSYFETNYSSCGDCYNCFHHNIVITTLMSH